MSNLKSPETQALDALTGGAFSAPTSGERAARVRDWLATDPPVERMNEVFRELSSRDKGAARVLREKLDEIKRARGQEAIATEWAEKARALLALPRINIADALAWQRDAAKAGAPLSRDPLAGLKAELAERVKGIEDLQHRVQVQREAAVLLAQRIEVLSTKSWKDAEAAAESLRTDVPEWQAQAGALVEDANWASVDARFPPLLEGSRAQLQVVWDAFQTALAQAVAAASDPQAALPPVPVWADELRQARGHAAPEAAPARPPKPKVDPELRAKATHAVSEVLAKLEKEMAEGHGKASAGAAAALRNALKEHGKLVDDKVEAHAHTALAAATELEGWQRWRADQLRQELVAKAEGLFEAPKPAGEGEEQAPPKPKFGGRKMQEQLRALREQWKQVDQGGAPNHALWKRFDEACNRAYEVVQSWLDKVKAEAAENRGKRLALIEEVRAWAAANAGAPDGDWKAVNRALHQFSDRWRDAGHLGEKAFAELQPQWKAAMDQASAQIDAAKKQSTERRHAMIDEAQALGASPMLRIDAVKALQQRWQAEAQSVPLDRKHEQKLWDAFRKPIDDAFQRKTQEREKASAAMSDRDRAVLDASKALDAASATGDAQKIRAAMQALEAAMRAQAAGPAPAAPAASAAPAGAPVAEAQPTAADAAPATAEEAPPEGEAASDASAEAAPAPAPTPAPPKPRPVVAVRGDDRPGAKKAAEPPQGMRGKFGDRRGPGAGGRPGDMRGGDRFGMRGDRRDDDREDRGPRLGDTAFRAQRDAVEHAQAALRKLAAQAHGEALGQLMAAWEQRSGEQLPSQQELGRGVAPAQRAAWTQALSGAPGGDTPEALLRLEIAADVPTPAEHISARRMLQLQLLTKRNAPQPAETWAEDLARVFASAYDAQAARRVQNALKVLLRRG